VLHLGTSVKFRRGRVRALAFTAIHEQQFPLPHCCGISGHSSTASAARTSDVLHVILLQVLPLTN
jgi:hypothetical protein